MPTPLPDDRRQHPDYAEVQGLPPPSPRRSARGGSDPATGSRSSRATTRRVHLRLRDLPGRRGVVPGQPPQRGGREPPTARPVRLLDRPLPLPVRRARRPIRAELPQVATLVCLDAGCRMRCPGTTSWRGLVPAWSTGRRRRPGDDRRDRRDDGPPQGRRAHGDQPRGDDRPHPDLLPVPAAGGRPVYLALAPLTHAAGVLCFPVLSRGGEIVIMRTPDVGASSTNPATSGHAHLPAADADLHGAGPPRSTRGSVVAACFWYGAAPMSSPASRRP